MSSPSTVFSAHAGLARRSGAIGNLSQRRINSSICFFTGVLIGRPMEIAWFCQEPMVFITTRASVKPRILSNHSAGAPSPMRPVALAAAARSGSALTSSLIFSSCPWSSSACKNPRKSSKAIMHSPVNIGSPPVNPASDGPCHV